MSSEEKRYHYRDFVVSAEQWRATAAIVLADDVHEVLAKLSTDYLAQAQARMREVVASVPVPVWELRWGSVVSGHGGPVRGEGHRHYLPFGSVGWLLRTEHERWFEPAAEQLAAGSPRLGLFIPDSAARESAFLRLRQGWLVPPAEDDLEDALAAVCADALDEWTNFHSDYWARLELRSREARARGELLCLGPDDDKLIPTDRFGDPPLWGAPYRALHSGDWAGFEAALEALRPVTSEVAFDVLNIGYRRMALAFRFSSAL
jgi:hypothetical protein